MPIVVVAGSLAAAGLGTVHGAAFGAAGGGLLGALVGWGGALDHVIKYEDHVKGGKYLRVARGDAGEVARAQDVLRDSKATELTCHGEDCSAPAA